MSSPAEMIVALWRGDGIRQTAEKIAAQR